MAMKPVSVSMWVMTAVMTVMTLVTAGAAVTGGENETAPVSLDCQRCSCGKQDSVFSLHCSLTGTEDVVLDGPGPLDFSSRTLYMRVENASSLFMGQRFMAALRRYYSVAVDLWSINNLTFAADFRPKKRFLFMGLGIVNCSLPELPQGVLSHSNAIGLRLSGSRVGILRRGAFAQVHKVRYIELTSTHLSTLEGPHTGRLQLSHRREVHHGSSGLRVADCSLGVLQEGALGVDMQAEDEDVEITDTEITEIGSGGLTISGIGSVTISNNVFRYLSTGALDISSSGGISLLNSRIFAAAPAPLWRVRGGNGTTIANITFAQPAAVSVVMLDRPTGEERVSGMRFQCGAGEERPREGWTKAATAGRHTVPAGLRRYLLSAEAAAECSPMSSPYTAALNPTAATSRLFTSPTQAGLEFLILTLAAAGVVGIVAAAVAVARRRRRRREEMDTQVLVEASDASEE